jgi:hypothetical protein
VAEQAYTLQDQAFPGGIVQVGGILSYQPFLFHFELSHALDLPEILLYL